MIAGLIRGLQPDVVIETGAAFGQTTAMILAALDENQHGMLITCEIDPQRRLGITPHPRLIILGNSLDVNPAEFAPIDFVFFDSLPELRVPEFRFYRRYMRSGTIVAWHDTAAQASGGLGKALREEIEQLNLSLIHLPTPRGLTLAEIK